MPHTHTHTLKLCSVGLDASLFCFLLTARKQPIPSSCLSLHPSLTSWSLSWHLDTPLLGNAPFSYWIHCSTQARKAHADTIQNGKKSRFVLLEMDDITRLKVVKKHKTHYTESVIFYRTDSALDSHSTLPPTRSYHQSERKETGFFFVAACGLEPIYFLRKASSESIDMDLGRSMGIPR